MYVQLPKIAIWNHVSVRLVGPYCVPTENPYSSFVDEQELLSHLLLCSYLWQKLAWRNLEKCTSVPEPVILVYAIADMVRFAFYTIQARCLS